MTGKSLQGAGHPQLQEALSSHPLCQTWKFPLSPWHAGIATPSRLPAEEPLRALPNPFQCARTGITESLVLLQGAHRGRSGKAGFPLSADGFWNEFACKPLIPLLLNSFTLPYCDGFPSFFSHTVTTVKDGSIINSLAKHKTLNKMKNSLDLVEDSKIKPGAKANPEVISELCNG